MATDKGRSYERERELIEAHNLDAAIRMFINRWAPEGHGPRDFEADFIQIVQRVYREAQAPFIRELSAAMLHAPMQGVFVQKPTQSNT
jgi:hypothetical protein